MGSFYKRGKNYYVDIRSEGKRIRKKVGPSKRLAELVLKDIEVKVISPDLEGYEFEITGAGDKAGFTAMKDVEGIGLKIVLLTYGKGMKKRPKREGKKKRSKNGAKGLRLSKTVRGKIILPAISQINLKVLKQGNKKLSGIFPDQVKAEEKRDEEKKG